MRLLEWLRQRRAPPPIFPTLGEPFDLQPGQSAFFWTRYDPPPEGSRPPWTGIRMVGMTIGERPRLLARIRKALWRLVRRGR